MMASLKNVSLFNRRMYHILIIGLCLIPVGCAMTPERRHPTYPSYLSQVRTVLCMAPEFNVFNTSGAGLVRLDGQSLAAGEQITSAVARNLSEKGFNVVLAGAQSLDHPDVRSLKSLFRAANHAIQLHTYGPQIYAHKQAAFDYSLGPVVDLLDAHGADALLLVIGRQTASQAAAHTWLSIALVEPQGQIIWYSAYGDQQTLLLPDAPYAAAVVAKALAGLRGAIS